ncbi:hypothetical protein V490_05914 [Pseudogymnoascus sp. VKM F-3557]|nr:hypothetical protein V490_05914 [Pseudogymnoascus sp. VKM F-3557]
MGTSGYPPGWEADYDGETERWFYTHKPTGVRQYHFPKAGDEVELAAALSKTKAAAESKLKESPSADVKLGSSKPQASDATSARDDLSPDPNIRRSVSERVAPTSTQQIPNVFKQSFQAAQRSEATTVQQLPLLQTNQPALPPLNTQLLGTSKLPHQVASSAHPLRINTSLLNQGGNVSPLQSMSAGPWSHPTSKGPGLASNDRGAPYFAQGSQTVPGVSTTAASGPPLAPPKVLESGQTPTAGSKYDSRTDSHSSSAPHNDAGEIILSRLGLLYLSDSDKEDVITNFQNLALMYPDVTLSQLVDPHMELPRAKLPDRSNLDVSVGSSANVRDASPAPASAISADASLPIAFVAYSREPQPTHRTYTSPVAGPNPSFGAPSPSSAFDYQRRHYSTSNASITSTAIQTSHDRTNSSSFSSRRQDSIGTQTYSPQTRTELAQTAWGLKPGSAATEGPETKTGIPARPATTAPIQGFESSPEALGTRPSRQNSVSRKPLSSQSPIMNRPYRSLSWQPRDHSPNPQLPSSLVSEVPEEPSMPQQQIQAEVPPQQSEADRKELDRLNSIIEEQNKQLALLSQQNTQNLQDLQNQQNTAILHYGRQPDILGHQRHSSVPAPQFARNSTYTQSSLQNTHYPPSYPSVPVSPISRPESLVYSIRDEPRPLSLPEPAFSQDAGKPEGSEDTVENSIHAIDEFKNSAQFTVDASQHFSEDLAGQTDMSQGGIIQSNVEEPEVDVKDVIGHQPAEGTNENNVTASSIRDRSVSQGSAETDSKRGSWSHVRAHSATQQIPQGTGHDTATVQDRSESRGSNQTESKRGSWSHVRTQSGTQQIPDQTIRQITVTNIETPAVASESAQTADFVVTQEISNIPHQIYQHQIPRRASNSGSQQDNVPPREIQSAYIAQVPAQPPTQADSIEQSQHQVPNAPQSSHQRQISQPRVELQTQQHDIPQADPTSQSQPQSAQTYQTPSIMSQSAVHEINLQTALEAQIQQHFESSVSPQSVVSPQSAVSPPDPANPLYGFNSDSAVSDMSTPGLVHKEYFDPVSVRHSQVTATTQRRISKDFTAPVSIAEVVEPAQSHTRNPSISKYPKAEGSNYYEEKQAFFPAHAPLKTGSVRDADIQSEVYTEQKHTLPENTVEVPTATDSPVPVINGSPKSFDSAASSNPVQFIPFTRPKDVEVATKIHDTPGSKLDTIKQPDNTNINITATHTHSSKPSTSSWSEMAKPTYPPQPTFTFGVSGEDDSAAAESLYDGDGYGNYDDYSDDEPQFAVPHPHLLQVRRTS